MYKVKAVALDIMGNALEWLNKYGDEDQMELCEIITLDDDSPIPIRDLPLYDNWDVLLVFEHGVRDQVQILLDKLAIPKDRVIYPTDMDDHNAAVMSYIFKEPIRRLLRYCSYRREGYKYAIGQAEGLTYINAASDDIILPNMVFDLNNWAKEEMTEFYRLANEHFSFSEKQVLFCDIGANIGTTCIYFKKMIDKNIRILAVEPSDQNYRLLQVNSLLNELDTSDCIFVNKGLSDKQSTASFIYNPRNPGGSAVVLEEGKDRVELTTLDDIFESNKLDPETIKYIWIDVEGFEARVLAGAHNVLDHISVPILMEFTPRFYAQKEGEFELLMSELERFFSSFICIQDIERGSRPIGMLWEEQNHHDIQWDIFLLK